MNNFKLRKPCRNQIEMHFESLEILVPPDHKVRAVWEFVENMDTSPCFVAINTFYGEAGRPATCPKVIFALWLYSIIDGNSSARKLDELCKNHNIYKWIAGNVPINRTMLAEFRSNNSGKFEDLLTSCLAVMIKAKLLTDSDFSQDGTRIKANAGNNSYRREDTLQKLKQEMSIRLKELDKEAERTASAYEERVRINKIRLAQDRKNRIDEAIRNLELAKEEKISNGKKNNNRPTKEDLDKMRASITDPQARRMKMGDSGFRIAYNIQFVTGLDSRVIYGVDLLNGQDPGTVTRMMAKVHSRLSHLGLSEAKNWIADAAYSGKDEIENVAEWFPECKYYAPPLLEKSMAIKTTDSEAIKKWKSMYETKEMDEIYKKRCSTAEFSNAGVKNMGLREFLTRGIAKNKGVAILYAIAQNINRYLDLNKKDRIMA